MVDIEKSETHPGRDDGNKNCGISFSRLGDKIYNDIMSWYNNVNNWSLWVIMKVITDSNYTYDIINHDYIASGNNDYDYNYLTLCNQFPSNMDYTL